MPIAWNEIKSQEDVEALLKAFDGFRNSCLREVHVWTDHWIRQDLSMYYPSGLNTRIRILFQRQVQSPSAIEILFEKVTHFNLAPTPEHYYPVIFGARMYMEDGIVYWANEEEWSPESAAINLQTWVSAKEARWRDVSKWMGDELRYGPKEE
jgi:hypothetical protein